MFMRVKKLKEINIIAHVFRNYWNNKKSLRIVARAGMLRGSERGKHNVCRVRSHLGYSLCDNPEGPLLAEYLTSKPLFCSFARCKPCSFNGFSHVHYNSPCDSLFRGLFVVYFYLFYVPQFISVLGLAFNLFSLGKFVLVLLVFYSQWDFSVDARSLGFVLLNFAVFSAQFSVSLSGSFLY